MPVASVFLLERPCYNCMPIGTVEWLVGISLRLQLRSMIQKWVTLMQLIPKVCIVFTCLYLFALAIIVVLPLTVIVQLLFSLLNLEVSCFFDCCKDPLSTFKLFYYFLFYGYLLLKKLLSCFTVEKIVPHGYSTNRKKVNKFLQRFVHAYLICIALDIMLFS